MSSFSKSEVLRGAKIFRNSIVKGKGVPKEVTLKVRETGKNKTLTRKQFAGIMEATNVFRLKQGRYPNYTTLNSTANNPLVMNYQDDSVSCGCASFNMCVQLTYGEWIDEKAIKKTFGTGSSGTAPSQIIAGAKKYGYAVEKIARNSSAVKKALEKGYAILAHIDTKPATCLGYQNNYGHWTVIYGLDDGKYKIADPTKGIKTCSTKIYDKAMLGRTIYYYQVRPL
ncbi:MAG: C39 family peptidase [Methanobrevibacter sp.]|nr:C39 family peptidase [Methanobrevibacter sp.]